MVYAKQTGLCVPGSLSSSLAQESGSEAALSVTHPSFPGSCCTHADMVKPRDGWKLKLAAMLTNESCPPLNESTGEPPTAVMLVCTWRRGVVTRWPERPSFSKHYPPTSLKCGQSNNKDPRNHYSWWKDHSPSLLSHTPQDLHSYPPPLLSSLPSTPSLLPCLLHMYFSYTRQWGCVV